MALDPEFRHDYVWAPRLVPNNLSLAAYALDLFDVTNDVPPWLRTVIETEKKRHEDEPAAARHMVWQESMAIGDRLYLRDEVRFCWRCGVLVEEREWWSQSDGLCGHCLADYAVPLTPIAVKK